MNFSSGTFFIAWSWDRKTVQHSENDRNILYSINYTDILYLQRLESISYNIYYDRFTRGRHFKTFDLERPLLQKLFVCLLPLFRAITRKPIRIAGASITTMVGKICRL